MSSFLTAAIKVYYSISTFLIGKFSQIQINTFKQMLAIFYLFSCCVTGLQSLHLSLEHSKGNKTLLTFLFSTWMRHLLKSIKLIVKFLLEFDYHSIIKRKGKNAEKYLSNGNINTNCMHTPLEVSVSKAPNACIS